MNYYIYACYSRKNKLAAVQGKQNARKNKDGSKKALYNEYFVTKTST
ncbi:MAG: hypothetical protein K9H65_04520 [Bacteroidales bacterium]|nr:hypothetical protein [Bacteroidales bacterium]